MIFKDRDSKKNDLILLKKILLCNITEEQRFLVNRELNNMKKGDAGENDASYFINFYYGKSPNWAVIHDLRIEYNDQVAQIDHLLINRLFDFYILESKSYKNGIRITKFGEFESEYNNRFYGIRSPIEQNKRHIHLLNLLLRNENILPKRLGISIKPKYLNYILISPNSTIERPPKKYFNTDSVIKADTLKTVIEKNADHAPITEIGSLAKLSSFSTISEIAKKIVSFHTPKQTNWVARFGLSRDQLTPLKSLPVHPEKKDKYKYFCAKCKIGIPDNVAKFCWNNKVKFGGRAYCFDCQKSI